MCAQLSAGVEHMYWRENLSVRLTQHDDRVRRVPLGCKTFYHVWANGRRISETCFNQEK